MYIQTIASILIDDEIHDLILGDYSEQREIQEYIFISEPSDLENLLNKLMQVKKFNMINNIDNIYISSTIDEIKQALILLENKEIENIVFVYQN